MPNYCNNILDIYGDENDLQHFMSAIYTGDREYPQYDASDFSILPKLFPIPEELAKTVSGWSNDPEVQAEYERKYEENLAKYGFKDWYDWAVENWGTKWADAETFLTDDSVGHKSLEFQSAWCAPENGIDHVSKMYPMLKFVLSYYEPGCGFAGATAYHNGKKYYYYTENISIPEDEDNEDYWMLIEDAYMEMSGKMADLAKENLDKDDVTV